MYQVGDPLLLLDDVINDGIVAGIGEGWQTAMKSVKDRGAHEHPVTFTISNASHWQGVGLAQMIKRQVQERLVQFLLH